MEVMLFTLGGKPSAICVCMVVRSDLKHTLAMVDGRGGLLRCSCCRMMSETHFDRFIISS